MCMGKNNKEAGYQGRGLHSSDWEGSLDKGGKLYGLIEIVRHDKDLVLEIRDDYFNIYYVVTISVKTNIILCHTYVHNFCKAKYLCTYVRIDLGKNTIAYISLNRDIPKPWYCHCYIHYCRE